MSTIKTILKEIEILDKLRFHIECDPLFTLSKEEVEFLDKPTRVRHRELRERYFEYDCMVKDRTTLLERLRGDTE